MIIVVIIIYWLHLCTDIKGSKQAAVNGASSGMSSGSASVGSTSATTATPPPLVPAPTTSSSTSKLQSGDSHAALLKHHKDSHDQ